MAVISELIRVEDEVYLSFGDYTLSEKKKVSDYPFEGNFFKVKTYKESTRLEQNDLLVYESVPGTAVHRLTETDGVMEFTVEGPEDAEITLGMEEETDYEVFLDDASIGVITTNLSGKLTFSVELSQGKQVKVRVIRKEAWQRSEALRFSAVNADMNHQSGPDNVRPAMHGTPWWRSRRLRRLRAPGQEGRPRSGARLRRSV